MTRKTSHVVRRKKKRPYWGIVAFVALAALCAVGYAVYVYWSTRQLEANAQQSFYDMKTQEMQFAQFEQTLALRGQTPGQQQVGWSLEKRRQLERNYGRYAERLYDRRLNESERLILRVTRLFGECDVAAPPDYVQEVTRYIEKWRSTGRFERAVKQAQQRGYPEKIAAAFMARGLPPQYFYLAMQESDFKTCPSGKWTRWGYAKGMWQFIPETGRNYGLKIGPLEKEPRVDPDDDRCNWEKATDAAARYVKDIYTTDAQASGLLVMASYTWDERVIDLLRTMPADPRERNFWKLLTKYRNRVPSESYENVFSIVSAAVIGENPRLFGFNIPNPLASTDERFVNEIVSPRPVALPSASQGREVTAVALFLSGDYAEASGILTSPSSAPLSPRGHFYLACSRAALVITRQLDQSALVDARAELAQAGGAARFPADLPYISPRILQTLEAKPPR